MNNKLIVSNNNNLNKTFCGIDLFKLIAAVLVVFIHADEAKNEMITNVVTNCFSGMAVPFFFIVSGFFFEKVCLNLKIKNHSCLIMKRNYFSYIFFGK